MSVRDMSAQEAMREYLDHRGIHEQGKRDRLMQLAVFQDNFKCQRCGTCCRNQGQDGVLFTEEDIHRASAYLGIRPSKFREMLTKRGKQHFLTYEEQCPYLREGNRCAIYPVRPAPCMEFPFTSWNCINETLRTGVVCFHDQCPHAKAFVDKWLEEQK